jgi:nanoRNase/pAp phosphatase (c-di-AMP/oligoRNAs hydrolase)
MKNVESSAPHLKELIQHSRKVLVVTRSQASLDAVAATLALAETLRAFGRTVILATPEKLGSHLANLPGVNAFVTSIGPKSLVVSIDHEPGTIGKVSYAEEGSKFNLVITPQPGKAVGADNVNFSYSGGDYDLVIILDTPDQALLGGLNDSEAQMWQSIPFVNIDRHPANTQYGKVNILDPDSPSTSGIIVRLIIATKLPLTKVAAELLLMGIRDATKNFDQAGPDSFEEATQLSRIIRGQTGESTEERLVNEPLRGTELKRSQALG